MPRSIQFQVANSRTSGKLKRILRSARKRGDGYDQIARCLYAEHGVEITSNTLRTWAREWGFEPLVGAPRVVGDRTVTADDEADFHASVAAAGPGLLLAAGDGVIHTDGRNRTVIVPGSGVSADDERPEGDEPEHHPAAHPADGTTEDLWVQEQREKLRG